VLAVTLEVKDGNDTCIKAELLANLSVLYSVGNGTRMALMNLPDSAEVGKGSTCGSSSVAPMLVATFGNGHSLSLNFTKNMTLYRVDTLTVAYNLNDSTFFPDSKSTGTESVSTNLTGIQAQLNTTYRCFSASPVAMPKVNVTFTEMRMEAYMQSANLSKEETICTADASATTPAPKTTPATTTAAPTTSPGTPVQGNYNVTGSNGTCLLAKMGLQLNLTYTSTAQGKLVQEILNVQPGLVRASGSCGSTVATLSLTDELHFNLNFTFNLNSTTKKYHLGTISFDANMTDVTAPFHVVNNSLNYLRGTLGKSYMCSAEQTLLVNGNFTVNTFRLQVQPFGVNNNQFGAAEECQLDEDNMLIPIIVGAALAGLVLIVLIAYLIGRKRSHAGYQTI
ncbi:LAMP1 protein, partial [Amia calva]|nr:LAMP1 protein [Amia calva]